MIECLRDTLRDLYLCTQRSPSVMAIFGDFCFFAGKPNAEIVSYKPYWCEKKFMIMSAREGEWLDLIEQTYGGNARWLVNSQN